MKMKIALASLAAATALSAPAFSQSMVVVGRSAAAGCYHNAALHQYDMAALRDCNAAFDHNMMDRDTRARFEPEGHAASVVRDHAIEGGLMMRAVMDTMILSPPLIWTRETIDTAVDRIRAALDKAAKDLR